MTPQEMETMLRQTLADYRLSGSERTALGQVLAEVHLDGQRAAQYRALAFRLAQEALAEGGRPAEVVGWLEDVVKLLHPVKQGPAATAEVLFAPFDDVPARVVRLFTSVKQTADLCVFTVTDDRITNAVLGAHRRGVRIRIISDDDKALDLGADVHRLKEEGVPVRLDRTMAHMHHKFAIFDGAILLNGSYNWTRSAASENNENLVLTGERLLVDTFAKHFEKLWGLLGG